MMKKEIYILLAIQVVLPLHNRSYGQSATLTSATIKWVDFDIETIADVSCDDFENSFKDTYKAKFIFNKADLLQFHSLANNFKPVKNMRSFDTRGSIGLIYGKTTEKYCFTKFGYFYKDGNYYFNKQLLILITDKIFANHHPKYLDTLRQYE